MATKKKSAADKKPEDAGPASPEGNGGAAVAPAGQQAPQGQQPQQIQANLSILAQYVKDLSFESPNSPRSLKGPGENPKMNVNVNVRANAQGEGTFEVALNFDAKATNDAGVIYNVELVYGGLFRIQGVPEQFLQQVLFVDCPMLLFPFMRRIIADLTQEGAFPPLMLDPIDFARLFRENRAKVGAGAQNPQPQV